MFREFWMKTVNRKIIRFGVRDPGFCPGYADSAQLMIWDKSLNLFDVSKNTAEQHCLP